MSARRRSHLGVALAAVLATLAALLAAAPAQAEPWRPAQPLTPSSTGSKGSLDVAVNARGDAVAVFYENRLVGGTPTFAVLASRRPAGGRWSTPSVISGADPGVSSSEAAVGIDGGGRALVVWTSYNGTNYQVRSRTVPVRGATGPIRDVTPVTAGSNADLLAVAVSANGRAAAVWRGTDGPTGTTGTVTALGSPATLTTAGGTIYRPGVAVTSSGAATFVWGRVTAEPQWRVESCGWAAGAGGCDIPTTHAGFSVGNVAELPDVAVNDAGQAIICFSYRASSSSPSSVRYALRGPSGAWTPASNAAPGVVATTVGGGCSVGLRQDGTAVLVYTDSEGNVFAASRDGGGFDGRRQLNPPGEEHGLTDVAVGARGHVAAFITGGGVTRAAILPPSGRDFSGVRPVVVDTGAAPTSQAGVALDDQGNAYVAAMHAHCDTAGCPNYLFRVWTAMYDAAAPTLTRISVPSSARRGRTVRIAALGVTDRVSTVKAAWRFSDGTSATGLAVRKRLARAGRLRITLTLTDAAGRRSVRTASLIVRS